MASLEETGPGLERIALGAWLVAVLTRGLGVGADSMGGALGAWLALLKPL